MAKSQVGIGAMSLQYRVRGATGIEWEMRSGGVRLGSIHRGVRALARNRETPWAWHFELQVGPPGFEHHGFARTFEDAMDAVEKNWRLWLTAANLTDALAAQSARQ
jgi:hypothetical protein